MPRALSWPVRRSGAPCISSVANASASAWPQSTGSSGPTSARFARCGASLRCTLKSSGVGEELPVELDSRSSSGYVGVGLLALRAVELQLAGGRALLVLDVLVRLGQALLRGGQHAVRLVRAG